MHTCCIVWLKLTAGVRSLPYAQVEQQGLCQRGRRLIAAAIRSRAEAGMRHGMPHGIGRADVAMQEVAVRRQEALGALSPIPCLGTWLEMRRHDLQRRMGQHVVACSGQQAIACRQIHRMLVGMHAVFAKQPVQNRHVQQLRFSWIA